MREGLRRREIEGGREREKGVEKGCEKAVEGHGWLEIVASARPGRPKLGRGLKKGGREKAFMGNEKTQNVT